MDFLKNIINNQEDIKIGIMFSYKDSVLVKQETLEEFDMHVFDIPTLNIKVKDIDKLDKIIDKEFKIKYRNKLYINTYEYLDEECNKKIQINMGANVLNKNKVNGYVWMEQSKIVEENNTMDSLRQIIPIYNYNLSTKKQVV